MKKTKSLSGTESISNERVSDPLLVELLRFVKDRNLFKPGAHLLVGVSGGIDSVVLVHLLLRAGISVSIAHCNFQLRGKESDADEKFVQQLAKSLKLDLYSTRFDTVQLAESAHKTIQETARSLRYTWFEEIRNKHNLSCICTAHHLDDSIETFFINLLRGTGIKGLRGIPVKNKRIVRPLLFAAKQDLVTWAKENKLDFREDSSNKIDKYLRNKIRHHLIPLFEKENPSFRKTMSREMNYLQEAEQIVAASVKKAEKCVLKKEGAGWRLGKKDLLGLVPSGLYLYELLKPFGFHSSVVEDLKQVLDGNGKGGKVFYSASWELHIERDHLFISRIRSKKEPEAFFVEEKDRKYNAPFSFQTQTLPGTTTFQIPSDPAIACLDKSLLVFPLLLRKWKTGDRFQPLGMKGSKLLSDFFADRKFSRKMKQDCWVLESGGMIIWLAGYRIAEPVKIKPSSKHILKISMG